MSRGWLGVATQALTPALAKQFGLADSNGALVASVVAGSPAAAAGIAPGDVIVRWNDHATNDPMELATGRGRHQARFDRHGGADSRRQEELDQGQRPRASPPGGLKLRHG